MPQIREQIAMVHLPPSKTLKYLFHVRKTKKRQASQDACRFFFCPDGRTLSTSAPYRLFTRAWLLAYDRDKQTIWRRYSVYHRS